MGDELHGRILSLTTIYPHTNNPAEGRSVAFLDAALAAQGYAGTTLVLKPYAPGWLARRVPKWRHLAVCDLAKTSTDVRVIFARYLHVPIRYSLTQCADSMAGRACDLIAEHKLEFDVVHAESIYPAGPAAQKVAKRFGVPFILTLRDDLGHLKDMYARRGARQVFGPMFREAAAIFCIGPAQYRDVPQFLPRENPPPYVLAPNGVDTEGIEALVRQFPPPPEHPWGWIVGVGSLYRLKGFHETLHALKELDARGVRNWGYTVVGEGPYRHELERMAADMGLADRVVFRGKLPHAEALEAMHAGDIFCLPSWAEAFGNVYAEAALCGRAAIGCRGYGAELMIEENVTGKLVPPRDTHALADALEFLLSHPATARAMGARARERIRAFTWERTASQYGEQLGALVREH